MLKKLFAPKEKSKSIVITFHTTYDTMNLQDHFLQASIPGRLIPVPRSLSASCGIAWQGRLEDEDLIKAQIAKDHLEIDGLYIL